MNDKVNLAFYTQFVRFQGDPGETQACFQSPSNSQQRMIQSWAHGCGFAFEYTLATQIARVIKTPRPEPLTIPQMDEFHFLNFDSITDVGFGSSLLSGPDMLFEDLDRIDASQSFDALETLNVTQPSTSQPDSLYHSEPFLSDFETQGPIDQQITGSHVSDLLAERPNLYPSAIPCEDHLFQWPNAVDGRTTYGQQHPELEILTSMKSSNVQPELNILPPGVIQPDQISATSIESAHSLKIDRGRKTLRDRFSRRPSLQSSASGTFQEYVFDSRSPRMSSPASGGSGRRGPLDAATNAAAKAVKAIRACWRCKFLRKTCSVQNPCFACSKQTANSTLGWTSVACRRGNFTEEMPPLYLCPRSTAEDAFRNSSVETTAKEVEQSNEWSRVRIESREKTIRENCDSNPTTHLNSINLPQPDDLTTGLLSDSAYPQATAALQATVAPLNECIDSIIQETHMLLGSKQMVFSSIKAQWDNLEHLLRSAAQYQTTINSDQLIAQSLICLRSSLEAFTLHDSGFLKHTSHQACSKSSCLFDCIRKVNIDIDLFLTELSRVFFAKENMRARENWWLSTFYSFCIQAVVRRILMKLQTSPSSELATRQYLHLAIRLLAATSGSYDPLMRDYGSCEESLSSQPSPTVSDFRNAQIVVQQTSWKSKGIASSTDYLKQLFEDDEELYHNLTRTIVPDAVESQPPVQAFTALVSSSSSSLASPRLPNYDNEYNQPKVRAPWNPVPRPYRATSLSSMESVDDLPTNNHSSSVGEDDIPQVSQKTEYQIIERRYRTNLNDKIASLRDSIPSLRALFQKNSHSEQSQENLHGLEPAHKLNKATIITKATEYIKRLEKENEDIMAEIAENKRRVDEYKRMYIESSGAQKLQHDVIATQPERIVSNDARDKPDSGT